MKIKKSKTLAKQKSTEIKLKKALKNSANSETIPEKTEKPPSNLCKQKSISNETLGTIFIAITCLLFWFPYAYTEKIFIFSKIKHISLRPTLLTGFFSLAFVTVLYIRGIFTLKKQKFAMLSFLLNLTLFATIFEIFVSPQKEAAVFSPLKAAFISFSIATILFGVREMAKIIFMLLLITTFFFRLKLVSDAMGIFGFIAFLTMISGLYLEESINPKALKKELRYLLAR